MRNKNATRKLIILAMMTALTAVLANTIRIEGMAPMSTVFIVLGTLLMGPFHIILMAFSAAVLRIAVFGASPLALTGAVFGAVFSGFFYSVKPHFFSAAIGEIFGTGIIGSLLSYPVMVFFTGFQSDLYWLIYTPRFIGATLIGSVIAYFLYKRLQHLSFFRQTQTLFGVKTTHAVKS